MNILIRIFRTILLLIMATQIAKSLHFVAISGSLRVKSTNTGLLRACQKALSDGHTIDIVVVDLPNFNSDLENDVANFPTLVTEFRERVQVND